MLRGTHTRTDGRRAAQVRRAHRLGCGVPQPGLAGVVAPRHSTRPVVAASPLVLAGARGRSLALTRRRFRSALTRARFRTTCRVRAGGHALGWACAGGWYPMVCAGGWYPMAGGIASDHRGTAYWRRFRWVCALSVLQPTFSPHSSPLRPGRPPIRGRYAACDAASTARRSSGGKLSAPHATGWPTGYVALAGSALSLNQET